VERAQRLFEQAKLLGEPLENPLAIFAILDGLWSVNYFAFNGDALIELTNQYLALAEKENNKDALLTVNLDAGMALATMGSLERALTHFDRAMALYPAADPNALIALAGVDFRHPGLAFRAICSWLMGYPDTALSNCKKAVADARDSGHPITLLITLLLAAIMQIQCGRCDEATTAAEEIEALATEKELAFLLLGAKMVRRAVATLEGSATAVLEMIASTESLRRQSGMTLWTPSYKSDLATAYATLGQFDLAGASIRDALEHIETSKETWFEADVRCVAGEIALMSPERDAAGAQAHFERAIDVARLQKARSLELRAAANLARLWRDQDKRDEARELLAPIYGWFTEGFDTRDLLEAKALLDELAS
jgi:predicted ATPase